MSFGVIDSREDSGNHGLLVKAGDNLHSVAGSREDKVTKLKVSILTVRRFYFGIKV